MDSVLKDLIDFTKRFDAVKRVVLFGSRARGDYSEHSDYDIAIYGDLSPRERREFQYFCSEELRTLHKIDLIFTCNNLEDKLIKNIEKEGITLYDKV